ncbi:GNAT family N-acetyltransferase [Thiofilum flexile]|uniref:bifunctional acetate--CoA ligase family protein/GNAT family N-acetyltransferase n=1 Tax=Thiofilum flexile TaxID=125627 RepID=UPI00037EB9E4|nr:GNAT family N-acetyltransferase [Thiofilum flexile]
MGHHYLHQLLASHTVAVFGASEEPLAIGSMVLTNLIQAPFKGKILPINPNCEKVQELTCYPTLDAALQQSGLHVDLAVIATPADTVPSIVEQCGAHGVKGALILSGGFSETTQGRRLEQNFMEAAHHYNMHIIGPNCLGVIRPSRGLNVTYSRNQARAGNLALVSQSSAMCTAILDWAEPRKIGFSNVITLGDAADVDFGDALDYLALDPLTDSILLYVEGIHHVRSFMSGLRAASRMKPVVVLKAGRYEDGARAATSHTGALVGRDDAFDAALDRAGVVRVNTITQLFAAAEILASGMRVQQNRLAIVSNGGGPGVMATDRAVELGIRLAPLEPSLITALNKVLPKQWPHNNPIDILSDATPERYEAVLKLCLANDSIDGVLAMLTPQALTDPRGIAEVLARLKTTTKKPILACWMGDALVAAGREVLFNAGIPHFQAPESAIEAFSYLTTYRENQKMLLQMPPSVDTTQHGDPDIIGARLIIESVLSEGRKVLSTTESRAILAAFHIPCLPTILARSATEALVVAESIGFPVAMKISSPDIIHKSDVHGVRLNISSAQAVRSVYQDLIDSAKKQRPEARLEGVTIEKMHSSKTARELMVGVARDPVFGPVISFGTGGTTVEIHRDHAVALPPLNEYIIRKTIGRTRIARLLGEFRHMPAIKCEALITVLLRVSEMVSELPEIMEMDINPLLADEHGVMAVDARFVVGYPSGAGRKYSHMAIHPYPIDLVRKLQLADGTDVVIRPIRPEDAEMEQEFVRNLSMESRYMRFMQALRELTPEMLVRFTQIDYDREMAFIALARQNGKDAEAGVARYAINPDKVSCEFALVIADDWQGRGLGGLLMRSLMESARSKGCTLIIGEVLADNGNMIRLMTRLGFEKSRVEEGVVTVTKRITDDAF